MTFEIFCGARRISRTFAAISSLIEWMAAASPIDANSLPDDAAALRAVVARLMVKVEDLTGQLAKRDAYIAQLEHALVQMRRRIFGSTSERTPDGQMIFPFCSAIEAPPPRPPAPAAPQNGRTKRPRQVRLIPADLPEEMVACDLAEDQKPCPRCGLARTCIGCVETRQLDFNPGSYFVRVWRRSKYACKPCDGQLQTAPLPMPAGPIERGLPGPGLLAHTLVGKYCDALPLYRQSGIHARSDVHIPRSTLGDWVGQAVDLLAPIAEAVRIDVLVSRIVRTDDTVVRMLAPGKGRTIQARLWGYLGDAEHNQVVYEFTPDRKEQHPLKFLADYKGKVQADAYRGYDKLFRDGSRIELGCMAHCRRYFFEARDTDPERGGIALGYIRLLYEVEAQAADLDPPARAELRCQRAAPVLTGFKQWIDIEAMKLLAQSPMGEAMRYAQAQWTALTRYVDDGEAEIDNNAMERALRPVAVGRKNYLFVGSEEGGRWAAVAYTLIESCKLNGVEPFGYLRDVLMRVWTHPASRIAELMPRLWKPPP